MASHSVGNKPQVIDRDQLLERCLGRLDLMERILDKFESRFDQDIAELESLLGREDFTGLARTSHRIKGSAASVSAESLRDFAACIERAARASQPEETRKHLQELKRAWQNCRHAVRSVAVGAD